MKSYGQALALVPCHGADGRKVRASIAEVAEAFVRPESYTLDVDRLLLGREAAMRTVAVGVLHLVVHSARDLPKTDTMGQSHTEFLTRVRKLTARTGSCDPYVSISYSKYHKPREFVCEVGVISGGIDQCSLLDENDNRYA